MKTAIELNGVEHSQTAPIKNYTISRTLNHSKHHLDIKGKSIFKEIELHDSSCYFVIFVCVLPGFACLPVLLLG